MSGALLLVTGTPSTSTSASRRRAARRSRSCSTWSQVTMALLHPSADREELRRTRRWLRGTRPPHLRWVGAQVVTRGVLHRRRRLRLRGGVQRPSPPRGSSPSCFTLIVAPSRGRAPGEAHSVSGCDRGTMSLRLGHVTGAMVFQSTFRGQPGPCFSPGHSHDSPAPSRGPASPPALPLPARCSH